MAAWPYEDAYEWARHGAPLFGEEGWENTGHGDRETAYYVPAPLGTDCMICERPIQDGDSGDIWLVLDSDVPALRVLARHRECVLLMDLGHRVGICPCTRFLGLGLREAALEAARRLET